MDSPGSRPAEGHRWRRRRTDWYYIAGRGAHGSHFIRASRTNCQPAESSGMTGKGANQQEQVPCPQCGKRVQRRNLRKHERSQHDGVRRRRHACPFCKPGVHKTYSTFQDWKNHLHTTHDQCLEDDDPLDREEYAAGFKLDRWERFHPHRGGRERPGLSADSYFAEALWPIPGRSQRGAAGSTIYHPHSSHEGYDTRSRGSAGGMGVCRERPRGFRPRGRRDHLDGGRRVRDVYADETQGLGLGV